MLFTSASILWLISVYVMAASALLKYGQCSDHWPSGWERNISTGIAMKSAVEIHGPQRISHNVFYGLLTLLSFDILKGICMRNHCKNWTFFSHIQIWQVFTALCWAILNISYNINVFLIVFCIVVSFQCGVENSHHSQKQFNQIFSFLDRKLNNSAFYHDYHLIMLALKEIHIMIWIVFHFIYF